MSPDGADEPADLFTPSPGNPAGRPLPRRPAPAAPARTGPSPLPQGADARPVVVPGTTVAPEPSRPGVRFGRAWLLAAALALGALGGAAAGHLTATPPPAAAAPAAPAAPPPAAEAPAAPGVTAVSAEPDSPVSLPGPGSRDWVAPGVSADGGLVRAELAEEAIEFRAADTRPGRHGPFAVSWSGGVEPEPAGSGTGMLGVRPGGWVQFVVRSTGAAADLVVHLAGEATVAVAAAGTTRTTTVSGAAETVTVALGAGGATVTVAPAGGTEIGVVSAELR